MPTMFRSRPLRLPTTRPKPLFKDSPRERGYTAAWDRFSKNWRERHPFCAECMKGGRLRFCDVVDHKLPIRHGGALLDPANVWSICNHHHNGLKAKLEAHAESMGKLDHLIEWCDKPETRPSVCRGLVR